MPGQSGNPSGKNRSGLAALVRERTKNGEILVKLMYRVACRAEFKTSLTINGKVSEVRIRPSISESIEAIKWLADRGWGKARDIVDIDRESRPPFQVVLQGPLRDPLDTQAEPVDRQESELPALPAETLEIGFDLNLEDLED